MKRLFCTIFLLVLLDAAFAAATETPPGDDKPAAGTPSSPRRVAEGSGDLPAGFLAKISDEFYSGNWAAAQADAGVLLDKIQFKPTDKKVDTSANYYSVVLVTTAPDGKKQILRFIVHVPSVEEYTNRLPGISYKSTEKLYDVFVSTSSADTLTSSYLSTRDKNPLESQILGLVQRFAPPPKGQQTQPSRPVYGVLSEVDLPNPRSTIEVTDIVKSGCETLATGQVKYLNRPLTRLSFGVVSSFIVANSTSGVRVKIDNGKIAEDPISGNTNMGILNIHPKSYDADADDVGWGERFRFFVGGIISPDFGITGGAGLMIVRGLSVNTGVGVMIIDTPKNGETIGSAPINKKHPFKYGTATVFFIGAGYNF